MTGDRRGGSTCWEYKAPGGDGRHREQWPPTPRSAPALYVFKLLEARRGRGRASGLRSGDVIGTLAERRRPARTRVAVVRATATSQLVRDPDISVLYRSRV